MVAQAPLMPENPDEFPIRRFMENPRPIRFQRRRAYARRASAGSGISEGSGSFTFQRMGENNRLVPATTQSPVTGGTNGVPSMVTAMRRLACIHWIATSGLCVLR